MKEKITNVLKNVLIFLKKIFSNFKKMPNGFKAIKQFVKAKKTILMKILPVAIILITIIVVASCFKKEKPGNTVGNTKNLGLAVDNGKWIYYVEYDDNEAVGIYKVKNNGKKTEKVMEGNVCYLNIEGKYIYCIEYEKEEGQWNLIRVKKNGKKKETLIRDVDKNIVTVADKWVYYYKNSNLYRVKLNGTDKEKISDKNISYYQIDEKWIYFIYKTNGNQYIAKMKLNGEDIERIKKFDEKESGIALYKDGGKIYYISCESDSTYDYEYNLYRIKKNGKKEKKICKLDKNVQDINMQENGIYYTTTEDHSDYKIKYIKYNGTNKETIKNKGKFLNLCITKKWIVFLGEDDYDYSMQMISIDGEKEKDL